MMKCQMLFTVSMLLAAHVSCLGTEPVDLQYSDAEFVSQGPVILLESFEEINMLTELESRGRRLLTTGTYNRAAIANTTNVQRITYTGRESTWFSAIRATQVGVNQNPVAEVVSGGIGWNTVTVEIRSAEGRAFNVQVEIWGRF